MAVQPGGCSGLRYQLFFDDRALDGDISKDFGGGAVVTDRMSAPYLSGATTLPIAVEPTTRSLV